jgi:hypothetical protein
MGAYSSWASFAVAHHYVVYCCCKEIGMNWKTAPYCLLGDDILIGHPDLGKAYLRALTHLGVEYSETKTFTSKDMFEFAKRIYIRGEEVSPFSVSSVVDNLKKYPLLVSAMAGERVKGVTYEGGIEGGIERLYGTSLMMPYSFTKDVARKAYLCEMVSDVLRDRVAPGILVNEVLWDGDQIPKDFEVAEEPANRLFLHACLSYFRNDAFAHER